MADSLKLAADEGDLDTLKRLIEVEHVPINQSDDYGDTALHAAVAKGRASIVDYLLNKGADPNLRNKAGSTTLHKVVLAKYDQVQILRALLTHKGDPLIKNNAGLLPEQLANNPLVKEILVGDVMAVDEVEVPKLRHSRVIGKGGNKMREIQADTGTLIGVPKPDDPSTKITIRGRQEGVERAKQLILEAIKEPGKQKEEEESDGRTTTKLSIPKDKHRLIIGRNGNTVNEIRDETNVDIIIPPADSKDDDIIIKGETMEDIELAIKRIQEVIARNANNNNNNNYGGGGRRGSNSSNGRNTPEGGGGRGSNHTPEGSRRGGPRGPVKR